MQSEPKEDYRLSGLALVYWAMGRRAESDASLSSLTDKSASSDAYLIASVHAYRGEIEQAFDWLDRAFRAHDYGMLAIRADPLLRKLHRDPRFTALLSRMSLTEPGEEAHAHILTEGVDHNVVSDLSNKKRGT